MEIADLALRIGRNEARTEVLWEAHMAKRGDTKTPWVHLATMGLIALTSIAGIISPERAALLLRELIRAVL